MTTSEQEADAIRQAKWAAIKPTSDARALLIDGLYGLVERQARRIMQLEAQLEAMMEVLRGEDN